VSHFLHAFWSMVGHLVNTFLFILAGVIIVTRIAEESVGDSDHLGEDVVIGFAVYAGNMDGRIDK